MTAVETKDRQRGLRLPWRRRSLASALRSAARRLPEPLKERVFLAADFIIIGAQKCGTTSLYNYLALHPCVRRASKKELHFFDHHFQRGVAWYRQNFPTWMEKVYARLARGQRMVTGEASPYYIIHPHAPRRIRKVLPGVRLIALLRNPVDRAYSHYWHSVRTGLENLPFEEALEAESARLESELKRLKADGGYRSEPHVAFSYLSRGLYVDQLRIWYSLFPAERILVVASEELYAEAPAVYQRVLRFLGLPAWELPAYSRYNEGGEYPAMQADTRRRLLDYFAPKNEELYEFLGVRFPWDR